MTLDAKGEQLQQVEGGTCRVPRRSLALLQKRPPPDSLFVGKSHKFTKQSLERAALHLLSLRLKKVLTKPTQRGVLQWRIAVLIYAGRKKFAGRPLLPAQ